MLTEEIIHDQLEITKGILEDESPMEFEDYSHVKGYERALEFVLGKSKALFNKEDL